MSSEYGIPTAPVKETLSRRRYLQFSIRALLIALTVVAAVVGGIVATPLFAVIACLLYVGTSCVLLTTLFDGKGWIRGFAIGFTVPHILGYVVTLNSFARAEKLRFHKFRFYENGYQTSKHVVVIADSGYLGLISTTD